MEENKESKNLYNTGKESDTQFDRIHKYITNKYELHFNQIALDYEIRLKNASNKKWEVLNVDALHIELEQAGIKIKAQSLEIYLRSHLVSQYNPIKGYFENLPEWDGNPRMEKLFRKLKAKDAKDSDWICYMFTKWLVRAVKCGIEDNYVNKQCIVLISTIQHIGKTTFIRNLAPKVLKQYYSEGIDTSKDGLIKLASNFIINLDELVIGSGKNINAIKAFLSLAYINERLPYGKKQVLMKRSANLLSTENNIDILKDQTGNVRWLPLEIISIDFSYDLIDIDKVWAEAYYLAYKDPSFNPELTQEDILEIERRNQMFMSWSKEQELIYKYFEPGVDQSQFMTATDVAIELRAMGLTMNLSNANIGKALRALGFPSYRQKGHNRARGYLVKHKNLLSSKR